MHAWLGGGDREVLCKLLRVWRYCAGQGLRVLRGGALGVGGVDGLFKKIVLLAHVLPAGAAI